MTPSLTSNSFKQKVCDFACESSAEAAYELFCRSAPELSLSLIKRWLGESESDQCLNESSDSIVTHKEVDSEFANDIHNSDHLVEDLALSDTESDLIDERIDGNMTDSSSNKGQVFV